MNPDKTKKPERTIDKDAAKHLPALVQERLKRSSGKYRGDFMKRDANGSPLSLTCRLCGTEIAGWVKGSQVRSDIPVADQFLHHDNFRIVMLKLSDGSNYRTNVCVECADKIDENDPDDLEDLFCSDIEGWARAANASRIAPEDHERGFERIHGLSVIPGQKRIF